MENKFNIDNDERQRILSLHENATKKQYLNVLKEEVKNNSYTLLTDVMIQAHSTDPTTDLKLYKNTKLTVSTKKPGYLEYNGTYARPQNLTGMGGQTKGMVYYNCKTGKFFIPNVSVTFYDSEKTLTPNLKKICYQTTSQNNTAITSKAVGAKLLQKNVAALKQIILKNENSSGQNAVVQSGIQFFQTDKPNILKTKLVDAGKIGAKEISYDCVTGKFIIGNSLYNNEEFENGQLKPFCKSIQTPSQDKNKLNPQGTLTPKGNAPIVIPTDIDLSQITKDLPPELQTVLTPPTVDGQPNTQGQPDLNQILTQLQGLV